MISKKGGQTRKIITLTGHFAPDDSFAHFRPTWLFPQHATPPSFSGFKPLGRDKLVCMGSSNNPTNISCTHFLPPMRRTPSAHVSPYLPKGEKNSTSTGTRTSGSTSWL